MTVCVFVSHVRFFAAICRFPYFHRVLKCFYISCIVYLSHPGIIFHLVVAIDTLLILSGCDST